MHVNPATPLVGIGVRNVVAVGELDGFVVTGWLIGLCARAADVFEIEQTGNGPDCLISSSV
jgi:hypothetical protein